jgi:hypothetical protein
MIQTMNMSEEPEHFLTLIKDVMLLQLNLHIIKNLQLIKDG